ncbi:transcriptional regulator, MarR family [Abditibacterium utsteinense]|uniref:Transcriptional regulator, MarR family n=1 Tax=Abditibacterium utsteinense TaxID=1960156 RepID=A0A2S8SSU3_9BACT|nr:MarR family transcriptional regulator [Abditibacterium utsteinense]PQV63809.1 transcriptional regulator, MarR family [Abditibacterium utsteinense]
MTETFLPRKLPRYECLEQRSRRYPDLDAGAVEATLVLMRVSSDILEAYAAHLARNGTSQGRFSIMIVLDLHTDHVLLPSDLACQIGISRATVTGLLDGLEKDGFVERRQHPEDRRALTVHLTSAGLAFLEAILPDHYRRIAALMSGLDVEERRQLVGLLTKVAAKVDAIRLEFPAQPKVENLAL